MQELPIVVQLTKHRKTPGNIVEQNKTLTALTTDTITVIVAKGLVNSTALDCGVGVTQQIYNRITNYSDTGIFSKQVREQIRQFLNKGPGLFHHLAND